MHRAGYKLYNESKKNAVFFSKTLINTLLITFFSAIAIPIASAQQSDLQTITGSSKGGTAWFYPRPALYAPGLVGFYVNFEPDRTDHEIYNFGINFPLKLISYSDKNGDDGFQYAVDLIPLPPGTTRTDHFVNKCWINPRPLIVEAKGYKGVPVLQGFSFYFSKKDDHHINTIKIDFEENRIGQLVLNVAFNDKNSDDEYCFAVKYALVPLDKVRLQGEESGRKSKGKATPQYNGGHQLKRPVLQGFALDFDSKDHQIDEIGVRLYDSDLHIFYNDKNDDDSFSWMVKWVDLR